MEKRALLAVILSIAFFYFFTSYFAPAPTNAPVTPVQKGATSAGPVVPAVAPAAAAAPVPVPAVSGERDVVVETPLYRAVFSTRGGTIKSFVLKNYTGDDRKSPIVLVDAKGPEALALKTAAEGFPLDPLALYAVEGTSLSVGAGENKNLVFTASTPQGLVIRKTYSFRGGDYGIGLRHQLLNQGSQPATGNLQLLLDYHLDPEAKGGQYEVHGPATFSDGKLESPDPKKLAEKPADFRKDVLWTAFGDKYFMRALLSAKSPIEGVITREVGKGDLRSTVSSPKLSLQPGQQGEIEYTVYMGPKDLDILKAQGKRLEEAVDLGWFSAIAKPLLQVLKYFYRYVHNYGIAIIIITVILKVLFYPLTYKSFKSMKEMQKLQPKMAKLREKFKNDRDAMNREVMKLYQEHKVNPLGGCFPMLVQIPVFFALYKALMFSIELRHAPFALWITDLSAKDPYYVTPIIMGATMVIQQKMTPSQMDPVQQKMMMALPVVFTFMFLNFPSGLVLYWLVNNVLTIGQQWYINKQFAE